MTTWTFDRLKKAVTPPQAYIHTQDLITLGVNNVKRAAKTYNYWKHGDLSRLRKRLYRDRFDEMLRSHSGVMESVNEIRDGWCLDTSRTLPHIDRVLDQAEAYIEQHNNSRQGAPQREFIRDIFKWDDLSAYPAFLDFILSPDVLTTVSRYMGLVPVLSNTVPPGVRFVESSNDDRPVGGPYRNSQLYHRDLHDWPLVYVILLLRDVTSQSGPFTFLSASVSDRVAAACGHGRRKRPFHLSDDDVYKVINREKEEHVMIYPKGTVLFLDSARCFHFGSRDAVTTRYQMMYAFVSPCRTDFTETLFTPRTYPVKPSDSALRRLVLDKYHRP